MLPAQNSDKIRPVCDEDLDMILSWRNEPTVRRRMYTQHEISHEEHLRWWDAKKASPRDEYLIYLDRGKPTGFISFSEISRDWGTASWAFYAAPGAPKGTGSHMELIALDRCFGEMQLRKLCCEVLSSNPAVLSLHLKHGFVQEGLRRDHVKTADGFDSIHQLAIFAEDWAIRRPAMLARLAELDRKRGLEVAG